METFNDNNNPPSLEELILSSSTDQQQQQNVAVSLPFPFQRLKTTSNSSNIHRIKKTKKNHQSNSFITDHQIGTWLIRESLEPFPEKENNSLLPIKQPAIPNVQHWNIDDVCIFFEDILGINCYTPIIKEHLIDGIALLLLKEEHLIKTFKMPLDSRTKILQGIDKLQN